MGDTTGSWRCRRGCLGRGGIINHFLFEFQLIKSSLNSMMFGIGTRKARLHVNSFTNLLGEDDNGWGLSHKGLTWHGGVAKQFCNRFKENEATKIGILYDGIAGTLTYYKDNACKLRWLFAVFFYIYHTLSTNFCACLNYWWVSFCFVSLNRPRCRISRVEWGKMSWSFALGEG